MVTWSGICGGAAMVLCTVQYYSYFRGIFAGRVKPHVITWMIWSLIAGIGFAAQLTDHAGAGAWATGYTALLCLAVFALSFSHGDRSVTVIDALTLAFSLAAIVLWRVTSDPLNAVILISVANTLGFIPTIRKSYAKPYGEPIASYLVSNIKWGFALAALTSFTWTSTLYPLAAVGMATVFILFVQLRRFQLKSSAETGIA